MTQQIINIGTGPDSYTGDNLRTAFQKINQNFSQLYAGNVGGNILADTITANNLVSDGNITAGNITALYSLVSQGNVSGAYFIGNGSQLTGIISTANLGNLSITGTTQQIIAGTANASIILQPVAGRNVAFFLRSPSNVQANLSFASLANNETVISSGASIAITSPNLNLFSTGFLTITANSNPSVNTTGMIRINPTTGHMGFNTIPDGYTYTMRGDVYANAFYAAENITTGYSFATPGGLTGMNHLYQNDINGNVSLVRISHDNGNPAKFYDNNHTVLSGNLVVSQTGNVFGAGFPDAFVQIYSNVDAYSQLILQNLNNGPSSTGDIVVTADTGTDIAHFIDMGIAGSNYDNTSPSNSLGTSIYPLDAYLYAQGNNPGDTGGNLTIGAITASKVVRVIAGGGNAGNVITITSNTGVVPGANNVYSLGSQTSQWKDLWLSNNTLYLGGTPITVANGVLSVNGSPVSGTGNYSNTNVAAYLPVYSGNIAADHLFGNIQGVSGNLNTVTAVNLDVVNINARDSSGVNISSGGYNNLVVLATDVLVQNVPLTVAGNIISTVAGGLNITANTLPNGTAQTWNFGTAGALTLPGGTGFLYSLANEVYLNSDTNSFNSIDIVTNGDTTLRNQRSVKIIADSDGSGHNWTFNANGNLTLPSNNSTITYANGVSILSSSANTFISNTYIPSTANSSGTVGQFSFDANYVYICIATNTWKRANLSTW